MFMVERTYHLSGDEMTAFLSNLEDIMEPYATHCRRYLLLMEKVNERCFTVSSTGIRTIMQSVAMFPDLRVACVETLDGFSDLAETQAQLLEVAQEINNDIATIQQGYTDLLRALMDSCKSAD